MLRGLLLGMLLTLSGQYNPAGPVFPTAPPLPAPTFVTSCLTQGGASAGSIICAASGAIQAGDSCLMEVAYFSAPNLALTDVAIQDGNNIGHAIIPISGTLASSFQTTASGSLDYLFYAQNLNADGDFSFSVNFPTTPAVFGYVQAVCWRGADAVTPFGNFVFGSGLATSGLVGAGPVATSIPNSVVFSLTDIYGTGSWTADPTYTSFTPSGGGSGNLVQYLSFLTPGSYTSAMTISGGVGFVFDTVVVRP